jgi:hypothetical protein
MPLAILLLFNLVGGENGMIIKELNLHLIHQLVKDFIDAFIVKKLIFIFFQLL